MPRSASCKSALVAGLIRDNHLQMSLPIVRMIKWPAALFGFLYLVLVADSKAQTLVDLPRCEAVPQPDHQVSFQVDGIEKTRWHFGRQYPRPFFYPFIAASGASLTRMGHPGAPNHDHHRSIWFAHHKVNGIDFWSDNSLARIRQKMWLAYEDEDEETRMASLLGWFDEAGKEVMEQEFVVAISPDEKGGTFMEFQIELRPPKDVASVTLEKTNFGIFAVRVAKGISAHFGNGALSDSEGRKGEPAIFGKAARWMDYSGKVAKLSDDGGRSLAAEGITYFDHPKNPTHPTKWHVRSDGWMGASLCMDQGITIPSEKPLILRYLLHAHAGGYDSDVAEGVFERFSARPGFAVGKSKKKHRHYSVERVLSSKE